MQNQPTYDLKGFTAQELGFVLESLAKIPAPLMVSRPVFDKIASQMEDQDKKRDALAKAAATAAAAEAARKAAEQAGAAPSAAPSTPPDPGTAAVSQ